MILVLMEDRRKMTNLYMEEVKKSNELTRLLREEKSKVRTLGVGLEEESKRSLAMEAELERHLVQINSQTDELQASRIANKVSQFQNHFFPLLIQIFFQKFQELEDALRKARADADHFKKQLTEAHRVAMSQATAAAAPLYAHTEALTAAAVASSTSGHGNSSSISSSTSSLGGLTASSLVTAAMGKQPMHYESVYSTSSNQSSAKPRSSVSVKIDEFFCRTIFT